MEKKKNNIPAGIMASVILYVIDQVTKILAKMYVSDTPGITVIPGVFELFYLENRGAAFGMMENRQIFFIVIAVIMLIFAGYIYVKLPYSRIYTPLRIICILIAAGAVGNMTDRIVWNYVIDFLYISLIDFPVFNVADCYVCIAAVAAIVLLLTIYKDEPFEFLNRGKE